MRQLAWCARSFATDRSGAVAIYSTFVGMMLVSLAVLAVDYGRLTLLKSEMQNAADAAALAAAAQLDGQPNAINRAVAVGMNATIQMSNVVTSVPLKITALATFAAIDPADVAPTGNGDAAFARATLTVNDAPVLFAPILNLFSKSSAALTSNLSVEATARAAPFVCNAPTIMMCDISDQFGDFGEGLITDGGNGPLSTAWAGAQVILRERSTGLGNTVGFRVLCPPNQPGCTSAQAVNFGAAADPNLCGGDTVEMAGGTPTQTEINDTINARFGTGANNDESASNIVQYDRDSQGVQCCAATHPDGGYGTPDGTGQLWDANAYWAAQHNGEPLPEALGENPTRYQVHLYEVGAEFLRNGKRTIYPVPANPPPGYSPVPTSGPHPPTNGQPNGPAVSDPKRRVLKAVVLNANDCAIASNTPISTQGRILEIFVTENSANSFIFGEIIGPVTAQTAGDEWHPNVRLVR